MTRSSLVDDLPHSPQSRAGSLLEAVANVVAGFLLAFVVQGLVYPFLGIITTTKTNLLIALIFTLISLVRSYLVRRAFESLSRGSRRRVFWSAQGLLNGVRDIRRP